MNIPCFFAKFCDRSMWGIKFTTNSNSQPLPKCFPLLGIPRNSSVANRTEIHWIYTLLLFRKDRLSSRCRLMLPLKLMRITERDFIVEQNFRWIHHVLRNNNFGPEAVAALAGSWWLVCITYGINMYQPEIQPGVLRKNSTLVDLSLDLNAVGDRGKPSGWLWKVLLLLALN